MPSRSWKTLAGVTLVAAAVVVAGVAFTVAQPPQPGGGDPAPAARKVFTNSVVELPVSPVPTVNGMVVNEATAETKKQTLNFTVHMALPDEAQKEWTKAVARGEVLKKEDLNKFSPTEGDVKVVTDWLTEQKLKVTGTAKDRSSIYVSGAVEDIEKAFQTPFVKVKLDGVSVPAARLAPSMPAAVGTKVATVLGLQPVKAHTHSFKVPLPKAKPAAPAVAAIPLAEVQPVPQSPANQFTPPYGITDILKAYQADGLAQNGQVLTGNGQTIGILIDAAPIDADLKAFMTANKVKVNGQPVQHKVELVNVTGGQLPAASGEESLDAEWAAGLAPGAKVKVYATGSLDFDSLNQGLDMMIEDAKNDPTFRQVSISLGIGEIYNSRDVYDEQNKRFLKLSALGVNVFVSSGDAGSNPSQNGHSRNPNGLTAEFAASSPFVVAVGGTKLFMDNTGKVTSETGWEDSGGMASTYFDRPAWQKGTGVPPGGPTGAHRLVPDVSLVASGDTAALVILNGQAIGVGGTSWSAPAWAGFCALLNESRTAAGKDRLPFLNPFMYGWTDEQKGKAFRDITAGDNSGGFQFGGQTFFKCTAAYDRVTGLGSPILVEFKALTDAIGGPLPPAPTVELTEADFTPAGLAKLKAKNADLKGLKLLFSGDQVQGTVTK